MSQPQHAESPRFRLLLLGSPSLLDGSGAAVAGLGPGKPLAMLAYLVLAGPASREALVALLWDDMPEDRARNAFRQTLHRLRSALAPELIVAERDSVSFARDGTLWCDAVEFLSLAGTDQFDRALELYHGPFLGGLDVGSGPFEQWTEDQRQRMDAQYRDALRQACQLAQDTGRLDDAVTFGQKLSAAAPLDADAALMEATALLSAGRRPEAISTLTIYGNRVRSELGSAPPASIAGMIQRLLHEGDARQQPAAGGAGASAGYEINQPPFTGRDTELGRLLSAWRRIDKEAAAFIVTGSPGIGKTRLVSEFVQRLGGFGQTLVLWGQERPANQAVPYAAIAEALRPAVSAPGVGGASQHLLAEAARLLPELRDQFQLPDPSVIEDEAARLRFYDGIAALLDAVSYEQPVCMIVENLHLAAESSVTLLRYLTTRLASSPVMFVLTYRQGEAPQFLLNSFASEGPAGRAREGAAPGEERSVRAMKLGPLDEVAVTDIVASIGGTERIPESEIQRIVELAEGVPLRVVDLVRRHRNGQPLTTAPREIADILWAQLQSCSPIEQRLFLGSALYWRAVSLRTLAAATHLSEPDALDAALVLEKKGLITQRGGGIAPAHDSIAMLAVSGTGSAGLALLAGWAADALASDPEATNAELAHLYSLAGQKTAAHRHGRAAVHDAAASAAYDQVEMLLALAMQTASSETERAGVESLRRAMGGGTKRLPRFTPSAPVSTVTPNEILDEAPPVFAGPTGASERAPRPMLRVRRRDIVTAAAFGLVAIAGAVFFGGNRNDSFENGSFLADTLIVSEKLDARNARLYQLVGPIVTAPTLSRASSPAALAWIDSVALPWLNPRLSPDGRFVALERMSGDGTDLYLIRADRSDTMVVAVGPGDDIAAGWSPDGQWLLATRGSARGGSYDADLVAYSVAASAMGFTIDSTPARSIVDAAWSPLGTMIAWVAREGGTRQQDVFVSDAQGRGVRNLTNHPGEDYHIAWAPNGESLTFTSDRNGNAELYSIQLSSGALRRLTFDAAHDDRAAYSPDGTVLAFESTRAGSVSIYVMKPAGGNPRLVTPANRNFELAGWRGKAPPYVERVRVAAPQALSPGDSAVVAVQVTDQFGAPVSVRSVMWQSFGPATLVRRPAPASTAILRTSRAGLAGVVASVPGWREDTAYVRIGDVLSVLSESFDGGMSGDRWIPLGSPQPAPAAGRGSAGTPALLLNADNQWESGVLSRSVFPLRAGLSVRARIAAPFSSTSTSATVGLWLVAAEAEAGLDRDAPQFLKIAGIAWLEDAGRLAYSANREFATELASVIGLGGSHLFQMTVGRDNRISFYVDGRLRRRSTVLVTRPGEEPRVQLWIGGRGTGTTVVVDDVRVMVEDLR